MNDPCLSFTIVVCTLFVCLMIIDVVSLIVHGKHATKKEEE